MGELDALRNVQIRTTLFLANQLFVGVAEMPPV